MTGGAVSPEQLLQAKVALRKEILARREAAGDAWRQRASRTIVGKLLALPTYRTATVIAAYVSFGSELDTSGFITQALADGKRLLLPRINRAQRALELRRVIDPAADLVAGVWGIREPTERCEQLPESAVDFMLVPGVAFSANGARLGYGAGFYDRLLAGTDRRTPRVAAAFALQMVAQLPEGPHDERVDAVITES